MRRDIGDSVIPANEALGYQPGDAAAMQIAASLGQKFDFPTLQLVDKIFTMLEVVGGQGHVVALRREVAPDEYETFGFAIKYQTRDVRLKPEPDPESAAGWPITEFDLPGGGSEPPTPIRIGDQHTADASADYASEPEVASTEEGEAAQDDEDAIREEIERIADEEPATAG